jgi:hypothetical protein
MPYWSIYCVFCGGYVADALLECIAGVQHGKPEFKQLFHAQPGAALCCPYCSGFLGFDDQGQVIAAMSGWPVFRYGLRELEAKKLADGEKSTTSLMDWALRHRFTRPGTHQPLDGYLYAEHASPNEVVK